MRLCDIVDIKSAFMKKTVIAKILELVIIVNAIGVQEH